MMSFSRMTRSSLVGSPYGVAASWVCRSSNSGLARRTMLPPLQFVVDSVIACDIETYGIMEGRNQRFFHPRRSVADDRVLPRDLLVSLAFAWQERDGYHAAYFDLTNSEHTSQAHRWFRWARTQGQTLVGHHA